MVHMIDDRDFDVIFAFSPLSRGGILAKVTQVETKSGRLDHLLLVKQPHALLGEAEEGKRESGRGKEMRMVCRAWESLWSFFFVWSFGFDLSCHCCIGWRLGGRGDAKGKEGV
jgi:hypothetical protein